jgi:hypothetical protein
MSNIINTNTPVPFHLNSEEKNVQGGSVQMGEGTWIPVDVIRTILSFLTTADKARVMRTNHFFCQLVIIEGKTNYNVFYKYKYLAPLPPGSETALVCRTPSSVNVLQELHKLQELHNTWEEIESVIGDISSTCAAFAMHLNAPVPFDLAPEEEAMLKRSVQVGTGKWIISVDKIITIISFLTIADKARVMRTNRFFCQIVMTGEKVNYNSFFKYLTPLLPGRLEPFERALAQRIPFPVNTLQKLHSMWKQTEMCVTIHISRYLLPLEEINELEALFRAFSPWKITHLVTTEDIDSCIKAAQW